jgi:hypothetical protein
MANPLPADEPQIPDHELLRCIGRLRLRGSPAYLNMRDPFGPTVDVSRRVWRAEFLPRADRTRHPTRRPILP